MALRKCTSELKVRTSERWARRVLGWRKPLDVLGIRYDEPKRWRKALFEECNTEYPLVGARVTKPMVDAFWSRHPFDLGIPSRLGNCDLCFMKGKRNLVRTISREPDRAQWWIDHEQKILESFGRRVHKSEMAQFSMRYTYRELLEEASHSQPAAHAHRRGRRYGNLVLLRRLIAALFPREPFALRFADSPTAGILDA